MPRFIMAAPGSWPAPTTTRYIVKVNRRHPRSADVQIVTNRGALMRLTFSYVRHVRTSETSTVAVSVPAQQGLLGSLSAGGCDSIQSMKVSEV